MLTVPQQATAILFYIKDRLLKDPTDAKLLADPAFVARLDQHFVTIFGIFTELYGYRVDALEQIISLVRECGQSWADRPADMKKIDDARDKDPEWFLSNKMLGGVCYVDLYAGNLLGIIDKIPYFKELGLTYLHLMPLFKRPNPLNDGGYAVTSYRDVEPRFGTFEQLREVAKALRDNGISLTIDFVFNHTSNEHEWAKRAVAGETEYEGYYWIFPDRSVPSAFEQTTFWMAGGYGQLSITWKQMGTTCENLPEAHKLLRGFNAVCRIAAPSLLFKSEAIVHPDFVVQYIDPMECQLSYNPLQMALIWEGMATRDSRMLAQALERRHNIAGGCAWVNYVRSHDDIGWTFADEDAAELGHESGYFHRRFLNDFYVNRIPGSFSRGVAFQENRKTGDARITGTTASLAGLETGEPGALGRILLAHSIVMSTGGIPLIYLGDEVGQLNDYSYMQDPARWDDSRWCNRPPYPAYRYDERQNPDNVAGQLYAGFRRLIKLRQETDAFRGGRLVGFTTHNPKVLGYQRMGKEYTVICLVNFDDDAQWVGREVFQFTKAWDIIEEKDIDLRDGIHLRSHQYVWLIPKWN